MFTTCSSYLDFPKSVVQLFLFSLVYSSPSAQPGSFFFLSKSRTGAFQRTVFLLDKSFFRECSEQRSGLTFSAGVDFLFDSAKARSLPRP
jgi:hypothetical protein